MIALNFSETMLQFCYIQFCYLTKFSFSNSDLHSVKKYLTKCPYSEFSRSIFLCIRTEYGWIPGISPYSVQMREKTDQKNSKYGLFLRSVDVRRLIVTYFLHYVRNSTFWTAKKAWKVYQLFYKYFSLQGVLFIPAFYVYSLFKYLCSFSQVI